MKNFNLNAFAVKELEKSKMIEVNGGQLDAGPSPWWSIASTLINAAYLALKAAAEAYVEYSMETGGKYVIHKAY